MVWPGLPGPLLVRPVTAAGPDSISGLKNWWRTDDVDLNGTRISAVNFKVAGSKDIAKSTPSKQPLLLVGGLNGQDIAQHTDAREDQLNNSGDLGPASIPADSDWTVFFLFRADGAWGVNKRLLTGRQESNNSQVLGFQMASSNRLLVEVAAGTGQNFHGGMTADTWNVVRASYEDAAQEATSEVNNGTRKTAATSAYSATWNDIYVPDGSVFGDFSWGDIFIYDRLLTPAEDQVIYDYFNSFWGLSL